MKLYYRLISWLLIITCNCVFAEVVGVDPDRLEAMVDQHDALLIDVRTPEEWQETGVIPSSKTMMFFDENGEYDSEKWLAQLKKLKKPGQPVILVCRSGRRSAKVGAFLDREVGLKDIYHLENGITAWIQQGKTTQSCTGQSC